MQAFHVYARLTPSVDVHVSLHSEEMPPPPLPVSINTSRSKGSSQNDSSSLLPISNVTDCVEYPLLPDREFRRKKKKAARLESRSQDAPSSSMEALPSIIPRAMPDDVFSRESSVVPDGAYDYALSLLPVATQGDPWSSRASPQGAPESCLPRSLSRAPASAGGSSLVLSTDPSGHGLVPERKKKTSKKHRTVRDETDRPSMSDPSSVDVVRGLTMEDRSKDDNVVGNDGPSQSISSQFNHTELYRSLTGLVAEHAGRSEMVARDNRSSRSVTDLMPHDLGHREGLRDRLEDVPYGVHDQGSHSILRDTPVPTQGTQMKKKRKRSEMIASVDDDTTIQALQTDDTMISASPVPVFDSNPRPLSRKEKREKKNKECQESILPYAPSSKATESPVGEASVPDKKAGQMKSKGKEKKERETMAGEISSSRPKKSVSVICHGATDLDCINNLKPKRRPKLTPKPPTANKRTKGWKLLPVTEQSRLRLEY
jgi:hypothetical protein